jgi:hypothetical protein
MKRNRLCAAIGATVVSQRAMTGAPAWAQSGLEEIAVTGTHREANLQPHQ